MYTLQACYTILMVGIFLLSGIHNVHASAAEDILNKADALYSGTTTYQATYHLERKDLDKHGHNDYFEAEMVQVKTYGTTKFALHKIYDQPNRHKRNDDLPSTLDIVDDGKDLYNYSTDHTYYTRSRHDEFAFSAENEDQWLYMLLPLLKPREGFTYSVHRPTIFNGKAAYVIKAKGSVQEETAMTYEWKTVKGQPFEMMHFPKRPFEKICKSQ